MQKSIDLPGFRHRNPIPAGCLIGPFLFSGALTGRDPNSGDMPSSLEDQMANVFVHVRHLLAAAGGSIEDIGKLTFHLADYRDRDELNRQWLTMFPNPQSRPARQVVHASLDGGALVHCEVVAVLESAT